MNVWQSSTRQDENIILAAKEKQENTDTYKMYNKKIIEFIRSSKGLATDVNVLRTGGQS